MSENIVEMVKSQLGGGSVDKLSSFLGESNEKTHSALGAAIPTLLAGLTHVASKPEGAQKVSELAAQHEGTAGNFEDAISTQGGGTLAAKGSMGLSSLFGGGMLSGVSTVLGRFTGLNTGKTNSLIGVAAPLVLGALGKYQRSAGLNATGLSGFLTSQKQNIMGAMPSGLSTMLGSIPGLGGFGGAAQGEVGAAEKEVYERGATASRELRPEPAGTGGGKWTLAAAALVAALALIWVVSNRRGTEGPRVASRDAGPMINEAAGARPEPASISSGLNQTLASVNTILNNVSDPASAEKALPELRQANSRLANLQSSWQRLSASEKPTVTTSVQGMMDPIEQRIAKLRTATGVGEKLKPELDELEKHLGAFGGERANSNAAPQHAGDRKFKLD